MPYAYAQQHILRHTHELDDDTLRHSRACGRWGAPRNVTDALESTGRISLLRLTRLPDVRERHMFLSSFLFDDECLRS